MAMVIKMVMTLFILNMFLYLGINLIAGLPDDNNNSYYLNQQLNFHFDGDLLQSWMGSQSQLDNTITYARDNYTNYNVNLTGGLTVEPQKVGGGINGLTSFIDVVDTVWSFIKTLLNIVQSPLTLFFNYRLPFIIGFMIALPYAFCLMLGIIWFIRGMPS